MYIYHIHTYIYIHINTVFLWLSVVCNHLIKQSGCQDVAEATSGLTLR